MGFDTLPVQNKRRPELIRGRITTREALPRNVKARNLGDVIFASETAQAQTTLSNGEQAVFTVNISQNTSYPLQGNIYIALYVGSVASANLLPGGASIDESQWQIIVRNSLEDWENADTVLDKEYASVYVRNISAGAAQVVILRTKWKYFSPREGVE
jgi:hypothetical protein